jgi:hypothetical protein
MIAIFLSTAACWPAFTQQEAGHIRAALCQIVYRVIEPEVKFDSCATADKPHLRIKAVGRSISTDQCMVVGILDVYTDEEHEDYYIEQNFLPVGAVVDCGLERFDEIYCRDYKHGERNEWAAWMEHVQNAYYGVSKE